VTPPRNPAECIPQWVPKSRVERSIESDCVHDDGWAGDVSVDILDGQVELQLVDHVPDDT
jgi:hypothetical protein